MLNGNGWTKELYYICQTHGINGINSSMSTLKIIFVHRFWPSRGGHSELHSCASCTEQNGELHKILLMIAQCQLSI